METLAYYTLQHKKTADLFAGEYPGSADKRLHHLKIDILNHLRPGLIVNLMEIDELSRFRSYAPYVDAPIVSHPIRDNSIPTPHEMVTILKTITGAIDSGRRVYLHCWGGHGRTGTVVGCLMKSRGLTTAEALSQLARLRLNSPFGRKPSPQTPDQIDFVTKWDRQPLDGKIVSQR
jgi:hypothetical protein